jgi:hypothetical protein
MRRLVVFLTLLALAAPLTAAGVALAPGDGTLSVQNLDGFIEIRAKGTVIGRCDQCNLLLVERYVGGDEIDPVVSGPARRIDVDADGDNERFIGKDMRWKLLGGSFRMVVRSGVDVDLSAVGNGRVWVRGTKGSYVLNGDDTASVLSELLSFRLNATAIVP